MTKVLNFYPVICPANDRTDGDADNIEQLMPFRAIYPRIANLGKMLPYRANRHIGQLVVSISIVLTTSIPFIELYFRCNRPDLGNNNATWCLLGSRLYAIRTDGSGLQALHIPGDVMQPVWSPMPALQVGGTYAITELGEDLNLRASPALDGEVVKKLHEGDEILVLEGPVEASQYL